MGFAFARSKVGCGGGAALHGYRLARCLVLREWFGEFLFPDVAEELASEFAPHRHTPLACIGGPHLRCASSPTNGVLFRPASRIGDPERGPRAAELLANSTPAPRPQPRMVLPSEQRLWKGMSWSFALRLVGSSSFALAWWEGWVILFGTEMG